MGGGEMCGDNEILVSNFRFLPQILGGGMLLLIIKVTPPKW